MLVTGGMIRVTMDVGLSLFCAPCHRTDEGGAGELLTGGAVR